MPVVHRRLNVRRFSRRFVSILRSFFERFFFARSQPKTFARRVFLFALASFEQDAKKRKKRSTRTSNAVFSWGTGIRTPTNRFRAGCAAFTLYPKQLETALFYSYFSSRQFGATRFFTNSPAVFTFSPLMPGRVDVKVNTTALFL